MSRILVYIWAIFATEIDSIPYGIFFTITSIFKIRTSQNSSVKKGFSRGDCFVFFFFRFTAALTGTKSLLTRSGSESESCKGPGYH